MDCPQFVGQFKNVDIGRGGGGGTLFKLCHRCCSALSCHAMELFIQQQRGWMKSVQATITLSTATDRHRRCGIKLEEAAAKKSH